MAAEWRWKAAVAQAKAADLVRADVRSSATVSAHVDATWSRTRCQLRLEGRGHRDGASRAQPPCGPGASRRTWPPGLFSPVVRAAAGPELV